MHHGLFVGGADVFVFCHGIEAGTGGAGEGVVTYDEGFGITAFEYGEELTEGGTLCGGSCVGGLTE